jgi:DNA-binding transcriptional ArsR family regulator
MDGLTMDDDPGIPRIAGLLADPARARIVWMLIDGSTRPAGELAYAANVSAQSASAHLAKLVAGGLLDARTQGRHRYFSIASAEAAALVEGMASLSATLRPLAAVPPRSQPPQFLHARTCYGHLAGETAVRLLDAMVKARWLVPSRRDYAVTGTGEAKLSEIGVEVGAARNSRRLFARACVDLTQRRPHLGGALGDALLDLLIKRGWVQRMRRSRAVVITPSGEANLRRLFRV